MKQRYLYSISQIRAIEKMAIEEFQFLEFTLMQSAGQAAFLFLRQNWPAAKRITVICGQGNNGGDGYVLAKYAHEAQVDVEIRYLGTKDKFSASTSQAFTYCQEANLNILPFDPMECWTADVLVDALLGIGIKGEITGNYRKAIDSINKSGLPVLAIDVPSGLDADSGSLLGAAVKANSTITFIGLKQGFFTNDGLDYCGLVSVADLDLPKAIYQKVLPSGKLLSSKEITKRLPPRIYNSQKGNFGHILVIGGNRGMAGAVRLAAEAALRVGAGLVSVATHVGNASIICAKHPEIMCHELEVVDDLLPLLKKASVLVVGPGLGQDDWGQAVFKIAIHHPLPKVIDADGLNLLVKSPCYEPNSVFTPHPGEAARLLALSDAKQVQINRFLALSQLVVRGGCWVLKGAGTLIGENNRPVAVCKYGNPGMASGGMGDALSGIIAGLIAQHLSPYQAAKIGVIVHALAGDQAAKNARRGLLASDLIDCIRKIVN